jgi:hypothetical protein
MGHGGINSAMGLSQKRLPCWRAAVDRLLQPRRTALPLAETRQSILLRQDDTKIAAIL